MESFISRIRSGVGVLIALALMLSGCGTIPSDPYGSMERIRGGEMRVGVSNNGDWVQTHDSSDPTGVEPQLVASFASSLGSHIVWVSGGEEVLMEALDGGGLDLVVGGLTAKTPWTTKSAITRSYTEALNRKGEKESHVMAVRMGENALLSELERFLDTQTK
jgi:polar amino acid transport system substrate-binding protein